MIQISTQTMAILAVVWFASLVGLGFSLFRLATRGGDTTNYTQEDEEKVEEKQPLPYKEIITRITVKDDLGELESYYTDNDNGLGWNHVDGRLMIRQYLNPTNSLYNSLALLTNHCIFRVERKILDLKTGTIHTPEKTINDLQHFLETGEYEKK